MIPKVALDSLIRANEPFPGICVFFSGLSLNIHGHNDTRLIFDLKTKDFKAQNRTKFQRPEYVRGALFYDDIRVIFAFSLCQDDSGFNWWELDERWSATSR